MCAPPCRIELVTNSCVHRTDGQGATRITSGNGLSGMRDRIEELGGSLVLDSDENAGFARRPPFARPRRSVIRVFLADDEKLIRQGFRRLLELEEEIEITGEAADGDEVLKAVAIAKPDVFLLDIRMPRKNGLEVLSELATSERLPLTLV